MKLAKFHLSITIITEVGLFGYVIYSSAGTRTLLAVCMSWRIANIGKKANSANNGAMEMEFGSLDAGGDCEHNGVSFVEISKIFVMQGGIFIGMISFEDAYAVIESSSITPMRWCNDE